MVCRTYYRKTYPYYGKYKYKVEIENKDYNIFSYHNNPILTYPQSPQKKKKTKNAFKKKIEKFLKSNIGKGNYLANLPEYTSFWSIMLVDYKHFEILRKEYGNEFRFIYRPANGYENLTGKKPAKDQNLFYGRYPYKVSTTFTQDQTADLLKWCDEHLNSNQYSQYGYRNSITFYFMSAADAAAFKMVFADNVNESISIDHKQALKTLKDRVKKAENDLEAYKKNYKTYGI